MRLPLIAAALLVACAARAADPSALPTRSEDRGALLSPAALPWGALSVYVYGGAPEVAAGFRQGLAHFEIEGRASLDYFRVAFAAEATGRLRVWKADRIQFGVGMGVGGVFNLGATYLDRVNARAIGLRVTGSSRATYQATEMLVLAVEVAVPFERAVTRAFTYRFNPTGALGAEVLLSEEITLGIQGRAGLDAVSVAPGGGELRPTYGFVFGLGFRLF